MKAQMGNVVVVGPSRKEGRRILIGPRVQADQVMAYPSRGG